MPAQVTGAGSLLRIHLTNRTLGGYRAAYPTPEEKRRLGDLYEYLLDHGILMASSGMCALTTPMDEEDIKTLARVARDGLSRLAREC